MYGNVTSVVTVENRAITWSISKSFLPNSFVRPFYRAEFFISAQQQLIQVEISFVAQKN